MRWVLSSVLTFIVGISFVEKLLLHESGVFSGPGSLTLIGLLGVDPRRPDILTLIGLGVDLRFFVYTNAILYFTALAITSVVVFWPLLFSRSAHIAAIASFLLWTPVLACFTPENVCQSEGPGPSTLAISWFVVLLLYGVRRAVTGETWRSGLLMGVISIGASLVVLPTLLVFYYPLEVVFVFPLISAGWLIWLLIKGRLSQTQSSPP